VSLLGMSNTTELAVHPHLHTEALEYINLHLVEALKHLKYASMMANDVFGKDHPVARTIAAGALDHVGTVKANVDHFTTTERL
jgi:hypothetical protein